VPGLPPSRDGGGGVVRAGCRIRRLERPAHPLATTALTTDCGWTTHLEQGREWQHDPAHTAWLTHPCPEDVR
jgi:hypothetical protein